MDWKLFATTFLAIFLAEMGDKTQLATLSFAAGGSRWVVFAASALALVSTSALAVLLGEVVARYVDPLWIRRAAGALFLVLGVMFLFSRGDPPTAPVDATETTAESAES
jgi:putative Ca2+/H+ antiporter (TMEM165/GDT1 family)